MGFQTGDDGGLAFYINPRRNYARNDSIERILLYKVLCTICLRKGQVSSLFRSCLRGLGGWRVSSFLTIMSGLPLYFTASSASLQAPGNTQTPNWLLPSTFFMASAWAIPGSPPRASRLRRAPHSVYRAKLS